MSIVSISNYCAVVAAMVICFSDTNAETGEERASVILADPFVTHSLRILGRAFFSEGNGEFDLDNLISGNGVEAPGDLPPQGSVGVKTLLKAFPADGEYWGSHRLGLIKRSSEKCPDGGVIIWPRSAYGGTWVTDKALILPKSVDDSWLELSVAPPTKQNIACMAWLAAQTNLSFRSLL
ncbi:MAG: hypothetical protein LBF65_01405 [Holosporales bacterium]|jgi:hypothetical protein|nr:hypothetical protein [Holosporales bacterium]